MSAPVAVIGAGIAGLAAARALAAAGRPVVVFEKSAGVGGRCATRRSEVGPFDHGAQFLRQVGAEATPWLDSLQADRSVAAWTVDGRAAWVGVPDMNTMARSLAANLDIRLGVRISGLQRAPGGWRLQSGNASSPETFASVVCAVPAPQAADLLPTDFPQLAPVHALRYAPCWTLMLDAASAAHPSGSITDDPVLAWAARDADKPGRAASTRWVLQARGDWSRQHLEATEPEAAAMLLHAFTRRCGRDLGPGFLRAHRWRHALVENPLEVGALWDPALAIAVCGDAFQGARLEAAYRSGLQAADRVLHGSD